MLEVNVDIPCTRTRGIKIIDLTQDKKAPSCLCLEDWSDEAKEAGPKRRPWLDRSEKLGLRAKLAVDDNGVEAGMIQYGPIEHSNVGGAGLYFVYCIHVHGHKQGRGNFQGLGMGQRAREASRQRRAEVPFAGDEARLSACPSTHLRDESPAGDR